MIQSTQRFSGDIERVAMVVNSAKGSHPLLEHGNGHYIRNHVGLYYLHGYDVIYSLLSFSYPAVGGCKITHATTAERCVCLYHPTRMEMRFRHFETLGLLALPAQTDPEFLFVDVIGANLPDGYKMRLRELTVGLPQVVIVEHPPEPYRKVMQTVINQF